jgi:hypothetical protein
MSPYRLLVIGDSHIPRRAKEIHPKVLDKIEDLTNDQKFSYTFFTGDLISYDEFIEFLQSKTENNLFRVMGNMDYYAGRRESPVYEELSIDFKQSQGNPLKIGLTHGSQIENRGDHSQLEKLALKRNFNILISGHTHQEEVFLTSEGILLLNPGSVTGAWSFIASGNECFIVIDINEKEKSITSTLFCLAKNTRKLERSKKYFLFDGIKIKDKY